MIEIEKGFRLITFDIVLPFSFVGFLSEVSSILASEEIPIFAISAYSRDHILVKDEYIEKAISALSNHGFTLVPMSY